MTSDRWPQVDAVLQAALDRPPAEREAFVRQACGDDVALRSEVMSFLAHAVSGDRFLEPASSTPSTAIVPAARQFPAWPIVILAVPIVFRFLMFAVALMVEPWASPRFVPPWALVSVAGTFASVASVLLIYGRADRRAWALGLFILDAAATLLSPVVGTIHEAPTIVRIAQQTRSDAFQAALIWFFASGFPRPTHGRRLGAAFLTGTSVAYGLGVLIAASNAYVDVVEGTSSSALAMVAQLLRRSVTGQGDWYFALQFLLMTPLLVLMPLKLREAGPDDRRRFMWLAIGIGAGFLPLIVDTVLGAIWPWYGGTEGAPPFLRFRVTAMLLALPLVPIAAAYAALVQRTLDIRLVLRQALQYVLARSFIWGIGAAPFVALLIVIAFNRERSVADLVTGPTGVTLGVLTVAGLAAAFGRRRLMVVLDRRFFRPQIDARSLLLGVTEASRHAQSLDDVQRVVVETLDKVFHPSVVTVAAAGTDDYLYALNADLPPLARGSALALLLAGKNTPVEFSASSRAIVDRLSPENQRWLKKSRSVLLLPLLGANSELSGVVALGEKKSELPYRREDHQLLAAIGAPVGLALERVLAEARRPGRTDISPADSPALECLDCGAVLDAAAEACRCGGLLQRAAAPQVLEDRLRFDRRIGEGGMGVVYLAEDLRLRQRRAVKTLPTADPVMVAGMRREARSMAAAKHPNLATLHGLEIWRGVPMLVMEYLEGGTLGARLRSHPLSLTDTVSLGLRLADALDALHGRGVLHRDVKPSNIGFTSDGVPKLLDFGLAKLARRTSGPGSSTDGEFGSVWSQGYSSSGVGIRGTPAYLSPEILRGATPTVRDDLWGLSVTLLEACAGANPFQAESVAATVARVLADDVRAAAVPTTLSPEAQSLFNELLGSPDVRPKTAHQFARRLQQVHA